MKNKKVQTSKPKPKAKKLSKYPSQTIFGNLGLWGMRKGKLTDAIRDIIIKKMEDFIGGSEEWNSIPQFVAQLGVHYDTYMHWAATDPELKPIHKQFVMLLGAKRQPHAEWKKYGATDTIRSTLYQYHPDYKRLRDDDETAKKDLKQAGDEESKRDIIINIPAIGVKGE